MNTMLDIEAVRKELHANGFVVIRNAVTTGVCDEIQSLFMDYMEGLTNGNFKRDDPSTWTTEILPNRTNGLLQHYNVGLSKHAIRSRMAVKYIYEALFGTDKLTCSWDGTSFTKPPKVFRLKNLKDWKESCWDHTSKGTRVHIDQTDLGFNSVQGGLAITDQDEDAHVFVCVPGSHEHHEELLRIGQAELDEENERMRTEDAEKGGKKRPRKKMEEHWLIMGEKQSAYMREKGLDMLRVPLKRGDFVLWQSRLVHASATYCKTTNPDAFRIQVFVSMDVASNDPEEIKKRQKYCALKRVSKHSSKRLRLFGTKPRSFHHEQEVKHQAFTVPDCPDMTEEEKKLHGLIPY